VDRGDDDLFNEDMCVQALNASDVDRDSFLDMEE